MYQRYLPKNLSYSYGIQCLAHDMTKFGHAPFQTTWCEVEPNDQTTLHSHVEPEIFLAIQGCAEVSVDGEVFRFEAGDQIFLKSHSIHQVRNRSDTKFRFLSMYWEPNAAKSAKRISLVAAPPTPNGRLHLGHLSGPYFAAKMISGLASISGMEVQTHCGTDEFQSYALLGAQQNSSEPSRYISQLSEGILEDFQSTGIKWDSFIRTSQNRRYSRTVKRNFSKLVSSGVFTETQVEVWEDSDSELELYAGHIEGDCPHCGVRTGGGMCENCGMPNLPTEMSNIVSTGGIEKLKKARLNRFIFELEDYKVAIVKAIHSIDMDATVKDRLLNICQSTLPAYTVNHRADWGVQTSDYSLLVVDEWVEMALGYECTFSGDFDSKLVQCFGIDNLYFYGILHLGLYLAMGREDLIPSAFVTNEFLLFEGKKFSTSRGHGIWVHQLAPFVSKDFLTMLSAEFRPEAQEVNLTWKAMDDFINSRALESLETQLKRLSQCASQKFTRNFQCHSIHFLKLLRELEEIEQEICKDIFAIQQAWKLTLGFTGILQSYEAFEFYPNEASELLKRWLKLLLPFIPDFAKEALASKEALAMIHHKRDIFRLKLSRSHIKGLQENFDSRKVI